MISGGKRVLKGGREGVLRFERRVGGGGGGC